MVNALNGFGVAIGCVDIAGAVLFVLMIIYMLNQRRNESPKQMQLLLQMEQGYAAALYGNQVSHWMLRTYLFILSAWILVSLLMVTGIVLHKPQLLLFWIFWCLGGLVFDMIFVLLWIYELVFGDSIEALTNILISLLTMAIEFGFIYVIFNIYLNLRQSPTENKHYKNSMLRFLL